MAVKLFCFQFQVFASFFWCILYVFLVFFGQTYQSPMLRHGALLVYCIPNLYCGPCDLLEWAVKRGFSVGALLFYMRENGNMFRLCSVTPEGCASIGPPASHVTVLNCTVYSQIACRGYVRGNLAQDGENLGCLALNICWL